MSVADGTSNARERVASLARRAAERATPSVESVTETVSKTGRAAAERAQQAAASARGRVDDGVRTVTLGEFRDEVSAALADITEVLLLLDARVRVLEAKLADGDAPAQ